MIKEHKTPIIQNTAFDFSNEMQYFTGVTSEIIVYYPEKNRVVSLIPEREYRHLLSKYKDCTFAILYRTSEKQVEEVLYIKDNMLYKQDKFFSSYYYPKKFPHLYMVRNNGVWNIYIEYKSVNTYYIMKRTKKFASKLTTVIALYLAEIFGLEAGDYDFQKLKEHIEKLKPEEINYSYAGIDRFLKKETMVTINEFVSSLKKGYTAYMEVKVPRKFRNILDAIYFSGRLFVIIKKGAKFNSEKFKNLYHIPNEIEIEEVEDAS